MWCFLVIGLSTAYAIILAIIAYAWSRLPTTRPTAVNQAYVSVLIAARNEAAHLEALLQSIQQQSYPVTLFDVFLIDDHSTDHSQALIKPYLSTHLHLLHAPPGQAGKKQALALGIAQSKGDYIFTTDADSTLPPHWIKTLAKTLDEGADMVLAPVRLGERPGFLSAFQGLDVAGTMLLTGAAVQVGFPALANGANLGFTRTLLEQLGGYRVHSARSSGDDIFLLHAAVKAGADIRYLKNSEAIVDTAAVDSWQAFFRQRMRWAGKTSSYRHWGLLSFQAFVFGVSWALLVAPLLWPAFWYCWLVAWGIKMSSDGLFLAYACREVGHRRWLRWLPFASVAHTLYVATIGLLALLPISTQWKGRQVK